MPNCLASCQLPGPRRSRDPACCCSALLCGAWFAPSPTHTHIAHKSPLSLPPSPYWLQCQSPAGPSAALPLRLCQDQGTTQHSTTKHSHNQGNHQPASPSGRNQARGLLYASQQQKAGSQNPKTTTKQERHNLHADPSAFSAFSASSCPAGTWHFRLRLCPHAPSLLLTHTQHTARTQEQEKMSQQPGTCPRTTYELGLTWLAGGGPRPPRRAHFIHGGGGSIRPTRHGISSSTKGTTTQGARCDEPTKGTNHRAAGLSSSA